MTARSGAPSPLKSPQTGWSGHSLPKRAPVGDAEFHGAGGAQALRRAEEELYGDGRAADAVIGRVGGDDEVAEAVPVEVADGLGVEGGGDGPSGCVAALRAGVSNSRVAGASPCAEP